MKRSLSLIASAALLTASSLPAQAGEPSSARTSQPVETSSELGANSSLLFLAAVVAVALGIFLLIDDNDDEALSA